MKMPTIDRRKEYVRYAAHCSYLLTTATDPDASAIQREMAAEWIRLTEAMIFYPAFNGGNNQGDDGLIYVRSVKAPRERS